MFVKEWDGLHGQIVLRNVRLDLAHQVFAVGLLRVYIRPGPQGEALRAAFQHYTQTIDCCFQET